jgi:hypothetical protein
MQKENHYQLKHIFSPFFFSLFFILIGARRRGEKTPEKTQKRS